MIRIAVAQGWMTRTTQTNFSMVYVGNRVRPSSSSSSSPSPVAATAKKTFSSTSTSANLLEADAGVLGTKVHHQVNKLMGILTPIYFLIPTETYPTGSTLIGLALSGTVAMHTWIGLNYVATDYVPKVSHALLGPARLVVAGMAGTILFGLAKITLSSPGGIKGVVEGVWTGPKPSRSQKADA